MGGGVTFAVQTALYDALIKDGLSNHSAWRAAFAIVPVPLCLFVAAITLLFGTDSPAGKWSQRHTLPATRLAEQSGHHVELDPDEKKALEAKELEKDAGVITDVVAAEETGRFVALLPRHDR